jgi:hypothetical protein
VPINGAASKNESRSAIKPFVNVKRSTARHAIGRPPYVPLSVNSMNTCVSLCPNECTTACRSGINTKSLSNATLHARLPRRVPIMG